MLLFMELGCEGVEKAFDLDDWMGHNDANNMYREVCS